ncbi:hypothetical protein [Bacillus taeanensis]|uniref:hypothetical protein n=1 Tax=Bacillus taeanensis TaxID=273032 RepID=UPI0015EFED8D|nr:hypothetical protein [Bacillus taeanensis]
MKFLKKFLTEQCPTCKKTLVTPKVSSFCGGIVKSCPDGHYKKEYHPALETYIETE